MAPAGAVPPERSQIDDILGNSSELVIRRDGKTRESVHIGSALQQIRDALITVPPNNARALLRFFSASGEDLNMYVQTNPHPEAAIYYFPCQMQGGDYIIGWGLARSEDRGCASGINVRWGGSNWTRNPSERLEQVAASKQLAQASPRQVTYCGASSRRGQISFATATAGDPCTEALQECSSAGGADCAVIATGFWWTSEDQLQATLDCGENQVVSVTGTGADMADQIQALLPQAQGQSCSLQVYRPQDFVIVPAPDQVVLAQGDDEILVQTRETDRGLQVDVLKGAINVQSTDSERPQLVPQGQRYQHVPSGDSISTFNRQEALTSVDMEVLCAFASHPENNLQVSACHENGLSAAGAAPIAFCNREQASGGQAGDRREVQMSTNRGEMELEYEMFGVPDRLQIFHEGQEILDTGFISGSDRLTLPFSGKSGRVEIVVTGNDQIATTEWNYTLHCP